MSHDDGTSSAHFESPQADLDSLCAMCNTPTTNTCSTCKGTHYCSKICQKSDWPLHKLCCKVYSMFTLDTGVMNVVRSILFPSEDAKPLPMATTLYGDIKLEELKVVGWRLYLGLEGENDAEVEEKIDTLRITRNPLRRRDLRGPSTLLGRSRSIRVILS